MKLLIPVRDALDVLNGKWKLQIIIAMHAGNKRFKEFERQIPKITAKMLTKGLKELEAHELITRTVDETQRVTIEYTLTPYAKTLDKIIMALNDWGLQHRKKLFNK